MQSENNETPTLLRSHTLSLCLDTSLALTTSSRLKLIIWGGNTDVQVTKHLVKSQTVMHSHSNSPNNIADI